MTKPSTSIGELSERIEKLEAQQHALLEALKMLLPMAIAIPASASSSAQAIKEFSQALDQTEKTHAQPEAFWYLASTMLLLLSSRAKAQHPDDSEVAAIFQGVRAHRKQ